MPRAGSYWIGSNGRKHVTQFARIAASCMLLQACGGGISNKYSADLAVPGAANSKTGVVILSVGSRDTCHPSIGAATRLLIIHDSDSFVQNSEAALDVDPAFMDSEYTGHYGHLFVLPLPLGKYYLIPSAGPYAEHWTPPRADFEVFAHETSYLGEFYMDNMCGDPARFLFRDQETRDLSMLKSKNPAFGHIRITKRLLKFTGCDSFGAFC